MFLGRTFLRLVNCKLLVFGEGVGGSSFLTRRHWSDHPQKFLIPPFSSPGIPSPPFDRTNVCAVRGTVRVLDDKSDILQGTYFQNHCDASTTNYPRMTVLLLNIDLWYAILLLPPSHYDCRFSFRVVSSTKIVEFIPTVFRSFFNDFLVMCRVVRLNTVLLDVHRTTPLFRPLSFYPQYVSRK